MINKAIQTIGENGEMKNFLVEGGFSRCYKVTATGDFYLVAVDVSVHETQTRTHVCFFREQFITNKGKRENETKTVETLEDLYRDVAEEQKKVEIEFLRKAVIECGKDEQRKGKTWRERISEKIQRIRLRS